MANHKHKLYPIHRLIPNIVTLGALCSGLSSIRFALIDRWDMAVALIIVAAFLDGIDGSIARLLKATSNFGAQLDSLSDFVCFGVAPALILYMWVLEDLKRIGWGLVLFFVICCGMRLARFNTTLIEQHKEDWQKHFFTGVPAPAGAVLAILPLILTLEFGNTIFANSWFSAIYLPIIGVLLISRLPTFTMKGRKIPHNAMLPVMVVAILLLVSFVVETWITIITLSVIYLLSIPFSYAQSRKLSDSAI